MCSKMLLFALLLTVGNVIQAQTDWNQGIWKSAPIPQNATPEFSGMDPYGLSVGAAIATDCSIYWIWFKDKKLYCFNSLTSRAFVLDNPAKYIRSARQFYQQLQQEQSGQESKTNSKEN